MVSVQARCRRIPLGEVVRAHDVKSYRNTATIMRAGTQVEVTDAQKVRHGCLAARMSARPSSSRCVSRKPFSPPLA